MAQGLAGDNGAGRIVRTGGGKAPPARETAAKGASPPKGTAAIDYGHEQVVVVEVPLRTIAGAYASNRVDVHLSSRQSLAYRALYDAVIFRRERLANGAYVGNQQVDAIRWLLDKVADAADI